MDIFKNVRVYQAAKIKEMISAWLSRFKSVKLISDMS